MHNSKKKLILGKIISILILLVLFILPFSMTSLNLLNPEEKPEILFPFTVLFLNNLSNSSPLINISIFLFLIIPITILFFILSFFQKKPHKKTLYILTLLSVSIYLFCCISSLITFANTIRWFKTLPIYIYISFSIAFIFHISIIIYGIIKIKTRNQNHSEYKQLCIEEEQKEINIHEETKERIKRAKEKAKGDKEKTRKIKIQEKSSEKEFKKKKNRTHIKTKLIIVMLITITVILTTFVYTDLTNYKKLVMQTVNNTGGNQAEQVAAIYDFSDGLSAKIDSFIEGLKKTNVTSPFPCERVDIITTDNLEPMFLEKIDSTTLLPQFNIFSYTTALGHIHKIPEDEKKITSEQAKKFILNYQNEKTRKQPIYDEKKELCKYTFPVTFSIKEGHKLVGFSIVTYRREVLEKPYFQSKVFVLSISIVFFYVSIIITLFLADFIANPIIFLRGNIRRTANTLSTLLSGSAKIDPNSLTFDENIETKDEIKDLSIEINNIVSLVRGILPYISFHTLQNAEKNSNRSSITRELCFLFTDIRGFTTLCESLSPKEVIPILNHYLDIETQIILNNGGDVDKYVGDEMMAFFSGPRKEINACKAAMEIRKAMREAQQESIEKGTEPISMGIGINSGSVIFGPVGSDTRKDFTSIGDTVNLASRLESANKEYGSKAIISESVYEQLHDSFICRELDYITVKGKTEPVRIFEILQSSKISTEKLTDIKTLFENGLSFYRKMQWDKAEKYFSDCNMKYDDKPSQVFLRRIIHYKISPPNKNWKGVFVMDIK